MCSVPFGCISPSCPDTIPILTCDVWAQVALYSMYVACMAFHAKVSDPLIGGTYMTLLNTVTNLGGNWPSTLALWLVDPLTWKECRGPVGHSCGSPEAAGVSPRVVGVSGIDLKA